MIKSGRLGKKLLRLALIPVCGLLLSNAAIADYQANLLRVSDSQRQMSPAQAASIVRARHGGKVLKVSKKGNTYNVRVLLPSGTIKNITVNAAAKSK